MRILINAWRDTVHPLAGGSEETVDRLATGLAERGHDVVLRAGGPVTEHPYRVVDGGGKFTQYLAALPATARSGADVVVDVANGMTYYSPLARRGPVVCLVHHLHDVQWSQWFPPPVARFGSLLERRAMPRAYARSLFVAVSPSTADALVGVGVDRDRIRVVPNGVVLPTSSAARADEPLFVAVGRLVPHKRQDRLLAAWRRVQPVVGGRLVLVGDGPEADRLASLAGPGVELVGRVSEERKQELLAQAWLLLHASEVEGWGLVVLEAAAHGTPTLAYRVPGIRDAVVDGRTGVLVDDEDALVRSWIELAGDPERRARLGTGARERATEHTWEQTVDRFESVIEEAVAGEPAADARPPSKRELFKLFLKEKSEPIPFYSRLAERSIGEFPYPLDGVRVLDVGSGPGFYARAMRRRGADVVPVDLEVPSITALGDHLPAAVATDAGRLPFPDAAFDGVFCSNMLEHTPTPGSVFDEAARVLRDGGWAWISWTNWYSPWGGHNIVPFQYLGPERSIRAWRRLFGEPPKNIPFEGLWPTYVGRTLEMARSHPELEFVDAHPRYYPTQRWILRVPGVREVATWNCVIHLRRRPRGQAR